MTSKGLMVVALAIIVIVGGIFFATRSGSTSNTDAVLPATTTDMADTSMASTTATGDAGEGRISAPLESLAPGALLQESTSSTGTTGSTATKQYTMVDVAMHKDEKSCWSAIDAKVYDLTPWIHQHPGGARAILSMCGKDGTAAFSRQHGGQAKPAQELVQFFIGAL